MKYRQRDEKVRGDSPWVEYRLNPDGSEAYVKVTYSRTSVAKDVKTTTFGTLDLGWLSLGDLACVARTMSQALLEAQQKHQEYTDNLLRSVRRQLG